MKTARKGRILLLPLLLSLLPAACDRGGVERTTNEAGIEIVTVTRAVRAFPSVGSLGADPDLHLSSMDGDPANIFWAITAIRQLPEGGLLVADGQTGRIAIFGAGGEPERTMGGLGEIPGQFRTLSSIPLVSDDAIWAWDERANRMTVFDRGGEVTRAMRINPAQGAQLLATVDLLPDGRMVAASEGRAIVGPPAGQGQSVQRDTLRFAIHDANGQPIRELFAIPGNESLQMWQSPEENVVVSMTARLPFNRGASYAVLPDGIVGGPNDRFELRWWNLDGSLARVTQFVGVDMPIGDSDVARLREHWIEEAGGVPDRVEQIDQTFEAAPIPPIRPAFEKILAGAAGHVWVKELDPWEAGDARWWLFDAAGGEPLGHLSVPRDLELHEIGADYVLAVHRDATGLQHVRRYSLQLETP